MAVSEIEPLHRGYIRLTERFKANWTFHQFLRGVHQTFLGEPPAYKIDFNTIYDRLREVAGEVSSVAPTEALRDKFDRIDAELTLASRTLRLCDRALSPSLVRRFFDKVRPQDEKIVYHLLRFYFAQPELDEDVADKIDFLVTVAATAPGGDGLIARDPEQARQLFEAITAGCTWPAPEADAANAAIRAFDDLSGDLARVTSFEALVTEKHLDNIHTLKHRLGTALSDPRVLAAMGICSVKTKAVFRRLYEDEKRRLQDASGRIEGLEREFLKGGTTHLPEEFNRFRVTRQEFHRRETESNVRARDLLALKSSIADVLGKFDLADVNAEEIEEALEIPEGAERAGSGGPEDVLRGAVQKILAAVEMDDTGSQTVSHLGLEPWETRTARRAIVAGGKPSTARDALILEAASLRVKAEQEAAEWKQSLQSGRPVEGIVPEVRQTLALASETDHHFARMIQEAAEESQPEEMSSLIRARFRLLHAYSALWLLLDSRGSRTTVG
jgi:hypothetical protein